MDQHHTKAPWLQHPHASPTGSLSGPLNDPPGVPVSPPFHSADTLSPTAAPWAAQGAPPPALPHISSALSRSPSGGSPIAAALPLRGLPGPGVFLASRMPPPPGSAAAAGAPGVHPRPGAVGGGPFAGGALGGPGGPGLSLGLGAGRKAPDLVLQVGPRMPMVADQGADATAEAPPPASATSAFQPARKHITSAEALQQFLASESVKDFMAFILSLNEAVIGKKASDVVVVVPAPSAAGMPPPAALRHGQQQPQQAQEYSPVVPALLRLLDTLSAWVDEIPPVSQSLRYGNPAFRTWFARMAEAAVPMMQTLLPDNLRQASAELAPYFIDSWGNATRIDYGTGHETTFCALLYCLARLGLVKDQDRAALVLQVFRRYLELMRKIQTTYWLEPAGSHGVWGLDDYQFIPFIWGSAQLIAHPMIKPKSIHNPDILDMYAQEYMYLSCVQFVKKVKKGPLGETSPMLNDVSTVPTWAKVNSGMIKMYQVEVLSKLPIMQHFLFGSLLPFQDAAAAVAVVAGEAAAEAEAAPAPTPAPPALAGASEDGGAAGQEQQ